MKDQLEQRLERLKVEFEGGQRMLTEMESKRAGLKESLLRISGAIQVLEEELSRFTEPGVVDSKDEVVSTEPGSRGGENVTARATV